MLCSSEDRPRATLQENAAEVAMSKLLLRAGDFVVVSDGRKALILENAGDEAFPDLKTREVHEHPDAPNRMLNSDKPGRTFQAAKSTIHSAMEQTDRHEAEERSFVTQIMRRVDELVSSGVAKGLFIVAPPRVLGLIRKLVTPVVKAATRAEVGHDLTHLPVYEIEKRVVDWIGAEGAT
jgi:protein required for attachment to host cells